MTITAQDREIVEAFANFLSWGQQPSKPGTTSSWNPVTRRAVPPAWWAYALGYSSWCPPKGEL
jgi:hypothetical protein